MLISCARGRACPMADDQFRRPSKQTKLPGYAPNQEFSLVHVEVGLGGEALDLICGRLQEQYEVI